MGGTGNIIKGLEKLMNEVGIKVIKGHEVKKIISNKKITGVELDNQTVLKSDNVICNADPPAVYEKMLNGDANNSFLFKWKNKTNGILDGIICLLFWYKRKI